MKLSYNPYDQNVRKEETRNGDEKVREKSGGPVIESSSHDGCPNPDGEGKSPRNNGPYDEKRQAIHEAFPDFCKHRLIIFPGNRLCCEKIPVKIKELNVERLVQVKGFTETLDHFRRELRVERVHLTRLSRSQVNNQERNHHHEEKGDDFLYDASADKRQHNKCLK
jgi:hypothetical protein